jgi:rRNA maturation endonuclease Nob1
MFVEPLSFIVVPLALCLGTLLALAAAYDLVLFRRRKSQDESVYRCHDCRHIYTELHRTPLARCPHCGKQNELARN